VKNEHQTLLQQAQKLVNQYEAETETRIDLEEQIAYMEESKLEKTDAMKEINNQEQKKSQRIEAENNRLKDKIRRQDQDITQLKMQLQAINTKSQQPKQKNPSTGKCVGRQMRVDKIEHGQEFPRSADDDIRLRVGRQVRVEKTEKIEEFKSANVTVRSASLPRWTYSSTETTGNQSQRAAIPIVHNVPRGGSGIVSKARSNEGYAPPKNAQRDMLDSRRKISTEDQLDREMRSGMDELGVDDNDLCE